MTDLPIKLGSCIAGENSIGVGVGPLEEVGDDEEEDGIGDGDDDSESEDEGGEIEFK